MKWKVFKFGGLIGWIGLLYSSFIINNNFFFVEVKDKVFRIMIFDFSFIFVEVKVLVFDCDGIFVDIMLIYWRVWCKICKEIGFVFYKIDFYMLVGVFGKKIINILVK